MQTENLEGVLRAAYKELWPFSEKYKVDFDRYLITLGFVFAVPNVLVKKVLDIGTGIGIVPLALRLLGIKADGLERYIFPERGNQMFKIEDMANLEKIWHKHDLFVFNENTQNNLKADIVISDATIEHQKDPKGFLLKCSSFLPKDGYIILSTPNGSTLLQRLRFLLGRSPNWPIEEFFESGENFTGHWREYTLSELKYMFRKAGFEVLRAENRNALAKLKSPKDLRKNLRALVALASELIPGSREMNFILAKKK